MNSGQYRSKITRLLIPGARIVIVGLDKLCSEKAKLNGYEYFLYNLKVPYTLALKS